MEFDIEQLRKDVVSKRLMHNQMSLRHASDLIGISTVTLSRIERGGSLEVKTLCRVLDWLSAKPEKYFRKDIPLDEKIKSAMQRLKNLTINQ